MTPTIAIILAVPLALWALAWWDIQRRKHTEDSRYARVTSLADEVATLRRAISAEERAREASLAGHLYRHTELSDRISALEKNPATMSATKERMDVLEKAMAELVKQTRAELEEFRARTMTITSRVDSRRFGARPNG